MFYSNWEYALLLTGLLYVGVKGLLVSPPPENKDDYNFYGLRLDILLNIFHMIILAIKRSPKLCENITIKSIKLCK